MKSSYFVMDGSIPFDWYVKSIFEYLKKIPSYYTNNDCEELYKEIEEDINKSIAQLDFVKLSSIMEKIKYAKRGKIFYQDTQKNLTDIKLNEEVKRIINEEFIPVKIKFEMHSEEDKKATFFIESCGFKEKDKDNLEKIQAYEKSKQVSLALTIVDFTKKFPNLLNFQKFLDFDVFELQENLHFPDFFFGSFFPFFVSGFFFSSFFFVFAPPAFSSASFFFCSNSSLFFLASNCFTAKSYFSFSF